MKQEEMMEKGYLASQENADILERIIGRHATKIQKEREQKEREQKVYSSMSIDDVEKAIAILKTRGKKDGTKTIHVSGHITIYYEDTESDYMIEDELDL